MVSDRVDARDRPRQTIRVVSNTPWFSGRTYGSAVIEARVLSDAGLSVTAAECFATRGFDVAVLNCDLRRLLMFCLMRWLLPTARYKLVAVDPVLGQPSGFWGGVKARAERLLLSMVDLFIFYHKDTSQLESLYGIGAERICYVPFKINGYETVLATTPSDEGFILSCGRSYRDYGTFCQALRDLPYQARILAPAEQASEHGTVFDFNSMPSNVTLITDDGSGRSWIDWIARSRLVVLPLLPNTLTTVGISACLVAMALGKCVIITDGLATRGILEQGEAVIVPPCDPAALRAAIIRACEDSAFRTRVASVGRAYALSLEGVDRLARDVFEMVMKRLVRADGRLPGGLVRTTPG